MARSRTIGGSGFERDGHFVDCSDEATEKLFKFDQLGRRETTEDLAHGLQAAFADDGVTFATCGSDADGDHPTIAGEGAASREVEFFEALDGTRGRRWIDPQRFGEVAHSPTVTLDQQIERVDLTGVEGRVTLAEQLVAQLVCDCAATQFAPGISDAGENVDVGYRSFYWHRYRSGGWLGGAFHVADASQCPAECRIGSSRFGMIRAVSFRWEGNPMTVRKYSVLLFSVVLSVGAVSTTPASAGTPLPTGVGDFVPTVDVGAALSDLAGVSSTPCTVNSSNIAQLTAGASIVISTEDQTSLYPIVLALKDKTDSLVSMTCTPSLTIVGEETQINGTISNAALDLSGNFTLNCTFKQDLKIQADLSIGSALPKGALLSVRSADKLIPMVCSMVATFTDGTSLSGSVDGTAEVGNEESDACVGDTRSTCVPLAIDARVTITSTTGKLAGYTGKGTYELEPSFTLASLNQSFTQLGSALGKSSVRVFRTSPAVPSNDGSMKINFTRGSTRTDIVYPAVSSNGSSVLGNASLLAAVGPRSAKCSYVVSRGRKSVTLASVKSSAGGVLPTRTVSTKQYNAIRKGLGAKVGTKLNFVVSCGNLRTSQSVTLG